VRRRVETGLPADAAARQERDALLADEPRRRLGSVARVGVLGCKQDERPLRGGGQAKLARLVLGTASGAEFLVERHEEERQRWLGDPCRRGKRRRVRAQALALAQLTDERVQDRTVHAKRPNRPVRLVSS
jgi:hypothetical protein